MPDAVALMPLALLGGLLGPAQLLVDLLAHGQRLARRLVGRRDRGEADDDEQSHGKADSDEQDHGEQVRDAIRPAHSAFQFVAEEIAHPVHLDGLTVDDAGAVLELLGGGDGDLVEDA